MVLSVQSTISIKRKCVLISNCSREVLLTCGERRILKRSNLVGKGIGPLTTAPVRFAVQVSFGSKKANRVNKPQAGHFAKAGIEAGRGLLEFRVDESRLQELQVGNPFDVNLFTSGQFVDVTAVSKGKGFSGNIKRHNFRSQRASHGNSLSHRAPGSIGQCQDPGRVFKGKKMPGRLGGKSVTTQNLVVIRVDEGKKLLLIKGAVPGAVNARVVIRPSVKKGAI